MIPKRLKLTVAAKALDISPLSLRRLIHAGKVPAIKSETGRWFLPMNWVQRQTGNVLPSENIRCAIYARESSSQNKAALASQIEGLTNYAEAKGYQITHIVHEIASGVNDERKKLHRLFRRKDFNILLVEHKDRLTRFGFRWMEALAPFDIEVINLAEDSKTDLVEDLVAVITSFCARLYGQRRGRKKTRAVIAQLKKT